MEVVAGESAACASEGAADAYAVRADAWAVQLDLYLWDHAAEREVRDGGSGDPAAGVWGTEPARGGEGHGAGWHRHHAHCPILHLARDCDGQASASGIEPEPRGES